MPKKKIETKAQAEARRRAWEMKKPILIRPVDGVALRKLLTAEAKRQKRKSANEMACVILEEYFERQKKERLAS